MRPVVFKLLKQIFILFTQVGWFDDFIEERPNVPALKSSWNFAFIFDSKMTHTFDHDWFVAGTPNALVVNVEVALVMIWTYVASHTLSCSCFDRVYLLTIPFKLCPNWYTELIWLNRWCCSTRLKKQQIYVQPRDNWELHWEAVLRTCIFQDSLNCLTGRLKCKDISREMKVEEVVSMRLFRACSLGGGWLDVSVEQTMQWGAAC